MKQNYIVITTIYFPYFIKSDFAFFSTSVFLTSDFILDYNKRK